MVEALELRGTENVLEVGTGSGYAAAILGELCTEVFSIEGVQELALKTRLLLIRLCDTNASVVVDGTLGLEEQARYDAVAISAAAPGIPRPLIEQLRLPVVSYSQWERKSFNSGAHS